MYQPEALVVPVDSNQEPQKTLGQIMCESIVARRNTILQSRESALAYLKSIGVSIDKNGKTKVKPL